MEHEESFELNNLITTSGDWGHLSPPSNPPLPLQPSFMSKDMPRSELENWILPDLSSTPTDVELVQNYLRPAIQRIPAMEEECNMDWYVKMVEWRRLPAVVNAGFPSMNPWELPGIAPKEGRREMYYITDQVQLYFANLLNFDTPNGFWNNSGCWRTLIHGGDNKIVGVKKSLNFHMGNICSGTRANWIMNVYTAIEDSFIEDGLVLCHVFDDDYGPKCPPSHQVQCNGKQCTQPIRARGKAPLNSTPPRSLPIHYGPDWRLDPTLISYMANLENILLCDPGPDTSIDTENCSGRRGVPSTGDHGHCKKRKKKASVVWDYFTKIYARDLQGNVLTFAACNHCSKILTGSSKGGTTHLARHTCPCKLKPVEAGRMGKGEVNVLLPQASSA